MALQRTTWTDAQVDAIVTAVLDHGLNNNQAQRAAAAGELGLPPFKMPSSTVGYHVRAERRRREIDSLPAAARDDIGIFVNECARTLLLMAHEKVADLAKKGPKAPVTEGIAVAKLLQELAKLDAPIKPKGRATRRGRTTEPDRPQGFVAGLAANLPTAEPPSKDDTHNRENTQEHNSTAPPATHTTPQPHTNGPQNGVSAGVSAHHAQRIARRKAESPEFQREFERESAALAEVGRQLG